MMAKTKLGGLVRYQCVEATGEDLAPDTADGGMVSMPSCCLNERNPLIAYCIYVCVCVQMQLPRVFGAGSASRG